MTADAIVAYSSAQFLEIIEQRQPECAVVILNNVIDADPVQLLLSSIRLHPELKFVFLSGCELPALAEKLERHGLKFDSLLLPVRSSELAAAVNGNTMLHICDSSLPVI